MAGSSCGLGDGGGVNRDRIPQQDSQIAGRPMTTTRSTGLATPLRNQRETHEPPHQRREKLHVLDQALCTFFMNRAQRERAGPQGTHALGTVIEARSWPEGIGSRRHLLAPDRPSERLWLHAVRGYMRRPKHTTTSVPKEIANAHVVACEVELALCHRAPGMGFQEH